MSEQQKQTKKFFEKEAKNWSLRADFSTNKIPNTIIQRNTFVLKIIKKYKKKKHLDIGCGSGDLCFYASKITKQSIGIDFSSKMISIANNKFDRKNLSFINDNIFNYQPKEKFDVISAVGFLEYLSFKEINKIITYCYKNLTKSGILILGSRNRLYNLFSLNKFTELEAKLKTYKKFLKEAIDLNKFTLTRFLKNNKNYFEETPFSQPTTTGIKVNVRNQFTPGQINNLLSKHNFKINEISPINYHPVSPTIYNSGDKQIRKISNLIMMQKKKLALIPFSSSFIISAKKK
jgi:2-polyprenyl-3-methyl-5-hydroxy-6-metoxy-1,4-benzoquinol methylase